ncbi:MAG TPA: DUF374 domain-containing protein [Polyangiaceae bacterium]|nr:DUF374 domain-containing protein [Polyangiaceae bacterium]
MRFGRSALGLVLGIFVRAYLATLRVSVVLDARLDPLDPRPWVLCFWHGDQLALLGWKRRRPTVALVSRSADGQMQRFALAVQGMKVERGSTSRGGAAGLLAIVRRLRRGEDAAFAVDGPRGPRLAVQPGAHRAAELSGGVLVPMGSAAPRGVTLEKAWDKFRIPLPFSRVAVCLGAPLVASSSVEALKSAIVQATALAAGLATRPGGGRERAPGTPAFCPRRPPEKPSSNFQSSAE